MGHTFQAQAFGEVPVGGPQRLDTQGGNAYTVVGRSWAASQRASVRSGKYRSGLSVSGFTAATFSLAQVSRSASLSWEKDRLARVHLHAGVPQRQGQRQTGVHVEPTAGTRDQHVTGRRQSGEHRRDGQRRHARLHR
jgi:hypothetical protein